MVDINKARQAAKIHESEIRSSLDKIESSMVNNIKHGNIYEEFAKSVKFKLADFQDYFMNQWKSWKTQVIQDEEVKSSMASYKSPTINDFAIHNKSMSMTDGEQKELRNGLFEFASAAAGGKFKSAKVSKASETEGGKLKGDDQTTAPTLEDLQDMAGGTLDEWDQFMSEAYMQVLDNQMVADYKQQMGKIQAEVQRLIALAKQGIIGPEFVLIAMARVNQTKNGVLLTWMGKKTYAMNESINKISEDLYGMDTNAPNYTAELQHTSNETRNQTFQMNILTQDMQKVMTDTQTTFESVKGMIDEINRMRREIGQKMP